MVKITTSIAAWIKKSFRRTSENNRRYNYKQNDESYNDDQNHQNLLKSLNF